MENKRKYPAKVLLFGEYTVLQGAQALAIPFLGKFGEWINVDAIPTAYQNQFVPYLKWLKDHIKPTLLNFKKIESDYQNNLMYQSNIPDGYGLGSSGALCAAIYDRYAKKDEGDHNLAHLRADLASLESFFHGKSSGIDPIVSFVQRAILRQRNDQLYRINHIEWPEKWGIFIIDSGQPRSTLALVNVYHEKLQNATFKELVNRQLIPSVEHTIHFLLSQSWEMVWAHLEVISQFQSTHFGEMIPSHILPLWIQLSNTNHSRMKLCGAGGGGYFLVFSKDFERTLAMLDGREYVRVVGGY